LSTHHEQRILAGDCATRGGLPSHCGRAASAPTTHSDRREFGLDSQPLDDRGGISDVIVENRELRPPRDGRPTVLRVEPEPVCAAPRRRPTPGSGGQVRSRLAAGGGSQVRTRL
jgi:hypothetical protein